eukprot:scaffold19903_cov64-Phaeocystis_antarctica.AAC.3
MWSRLRAARGSPSPSLTRATSARPYRTSSAGPSRMVRTARRQRLAAAAAAAAGRREARSRSVLVAVVFNVLSVTPGDA